MKETDKIEHILINLLDIVDTLTTVLSASIKGNVYTNPERKPLYECEERIRRIRQDLLRD
jgi:hypothetical protein